MTETPVGRTGAVATLVLPGAAAAVFALGDGAAEAPAWLLGWALLTWALLVGVVCAVRLGRDLAARRAAAWPTVAVLVAGLVVAAWVVAAHPLWGGGSGVA